MNPWDYQTIRQYDASGVYPALPSNETGGQNRQGVVYPNVAGSLIARHDGSPCVDRGQPFVCFHCQQDPITSDDVSPCIGAQRQATAGVCIYDARGNGDGEKAATITGDHESRVTDYSNVVTFDCRNAGINEEMSGTLQAHGSGGFSYNCINPMCYTNNSFAEYDEGKPILRASGGDVGGGSEGLVVETKVNDKPPRKYIIRRLTPLECCRLQGFPDWWEDGVQGSDSARYKMWGNGIALPNAAYVIGCAKKLIQGKHQRPGYDGIKEQ